VIDDSARTFVGAGGLRGEMACFHAEKAASGAGGLVVRATRLRARVVFCGQEGPRCLLCLERSRLELENYLVGHVTLVQGETSCLLAGGARGMWETRCLVDTARNA